MYAHVIIKAKTSRNKVAIVTHMKCACEPCLCVVAVEDAIKRMVSLTVLKSVLKVIHRVAAVIAAVDANN